LDLSSRIPQSVVDAALPTWPAGFKFGNYILVQPQRHLLLCRRLLRATGVPTCAAL
jgi:hypothetical protein